VSDVRLRQVVERVAETRFDGVFASASFIAGERFETAGQQLPANLKRRVVAMCRMLQISGCNVYMVSGGCPYPVVVEVGTRHTNAYSLVSDPTRLPVSALRIIIIIIIIIIITPPSILSEDEWGDLECLYKACQAAITDGGLFTDTGVAYMNEVKNERQSENDNEMKTVSYFKGPDNRQELVQTRHKKERIAQR